MDISMYARRRRQLMQQIPPDAAVFIPAAQHMIRTRDVEYPFRQESNFLYLTGFLEPDAYLILLPGRPEGEYVLFNYADDPLQTQWNGAYIGQQKACDQYGADQSFPLAELERQLPHLLAGRTRIYTPFYFQSRANQLFQPLLETVRFDRKKVNPYPTEWHAVEPLIHVMRQLKTPEELQRMQKAADISVKGHERLLQSREPGLKEYQLSALFTFEVQWAGCVEAYPTIAACGSNACVLHYLEQQSTLKAGDLLLIDAGAEYEGYAADITRTYPVQGRFTAEQKDLYELVLSIQKTAIHAIRPGQTWEVLHHSAVQQMTQGLMDLKILNGSLNELLEQKAYSKFFMHSLGHWLGLDVHDVGPYQFQGKPIDFAAGMVLTIEPGIYIAADEPSVEPRWRGIGIRIEDDVCVAEQGYHVLTQALPKEIEDLYQF